MAAIAMNEITTIREESTAVKCSACEMQLPAGVAYCPNCGTPTPAFYAPTGTTPNNPTVSSSADNTPPPPYTNYGSQQYGTQSPYDAPPPPPNPYNTPPPPAYYPGKEQQYIKYTAFKAHRYPCRLGI